MFQEITRAVPVSLVFFIPVQIPSSLLFSPFPCPNPDGERMRASGGGSGEKKSGGGSGRSHGVGVDADGFLVGGGPGEPSARVTAVLDFGGKKVSTEIPGIMSCSG